MCLISTPLFHGLNSGTGIVTTVWSIHAAGMKVAYNNGDGLVLPLPGCHDQTKTYPAFYLCLISIGHVLLMASQGVLNTIVAKIIVILISSFWLITYSKVLCSFVPQCQ